MEAAPRLIAGAMSGTSADGVDVALTRIGGRGTKMSAELVRHHHLPYKPSLKSAIFAIRDGQTLRLAELASLGREISLAYARAVNESLLAAGLNHTDLAAIAAHGQTLFHDPPNTIQWLDPSLLAAEVGCAVVSDFRRADCAASGQGAPLVPFADYILFRDKIKSRALLNIGGIANLTFIPAAAGPDEIIAFDTGPGNCVSDFLMRLHFPAGPGFDEGGQLALSGTAEMSIVHAAALDPYFRSPPPKSTDGPAMLGIFNRALKSAGFSLEKMPLNDALATACCYTAITSGQSIQQLLPARPDEIIVSGGGSQNRFIMRELSMRALNMPIRETNELGIPSEAKEAIAFALLAAATLDGLPSNVPAATGARRGVVLGSITPKPQSAAL